MDRILVADESKALAAMTKAAIEAEIPAEVCVAHGADDVRRLLDADPNFVIAVAGLVVAGAPNGEIVDLIQSYGVPVIVLTGNIDPQVRDRLLQKQVVDYVVKQGPASVDHVAGLVKRIVHNRSIKTLVVDDAASSRAYLAGLLRAQNYQVFEAGSGKEALECLADQPDIRIVITDYEMPGMNGDELIAAIRNQWPREEKAIVGLSGRDDTSLSARLLKLGASDYLRKPFIVEEFYCRVNQNIDLIEQIQAIRNASERDYLTGLYNRKYLYETGQKLYDNASRGNLRLTAAMLDIDFFKKINDTYGHQAGDEAIRRVAQVLSGSVRNSDLLARYGGEEFCVLLISPDDRDLSHVFEKIRFAIEACPLTYQGQSIPMTISIGVATDLEDSLEGMLDQADKMLYQAKQGGRNRVVVAG